MPEHAAADNGGQVRLMGETMRVLLLSEDRDGEWQATSGQERHHTVVAEGTDQAIERHRREVADHRAPFQTETTVGGQQSVASHLGAHLAVPQDEMRQHSEYRTTRRALDAPNGHPTQTETDRRRMARQAPTAVTGRLVFQWEAEGEEEGEHAFEKRLPICYQAKIRCFVSKIDGDGAVFSGRFRRCAHVSLPGYQGAEGGETRWGQHVE